MHHGIGSVLKCCRYRVGCIIDIGRIHESIPMSNNEKPSLPRALNDAGNQLSVTWAPHKVRPNGDDSEV
jgi:hypothetical protein